MHKSTKVQNTQIKNSKILWEIQNANENIYLTYENRNYEIEIQTFEIHLERLNPIQTHKMN